MIQHARRVDASLKESTKPLTHAHFVSLGKKKMSTKHPWILFILVCLGTLKLFWMSDVAAFLLHHHCSIIFIRLEKEMVARCDNVKNKTFFCRTFSVLESIMYGI